MNILGNISVRAVIRKKNQLYQQKSYRNGISKSIFSTQFKLFYFSFVLLIYLFTIHRLCVENYLEGSSLIIPIRYPVSDFARDLLKKIHLDALFNVNDVSPKLYDNVRALNITKNFRIQLHYMKRFLETCRYAERLVFYCLHILFCDV